MSAEREHTHLWLDCRREIDREWNENAEWNSKKSYNLLFYKWKWNETQTKSTILMQTAVRVNCTDSKLQRCNWIKFIKMNSTFYSCFPLSLSTSLSIPPSHPVLVFWSPSFCCTPQHAAAMMLTLEKCHRKILLIFKLNFAKCLLRAHGHFALPHFSVFHIFSPNAIVPSSVNPVVCVLLINRCNASRCKQLANDEKKKIEINF